MFVGNAVVLIAAVTLLALTPARVPPPTSLLAIVLILAGLGAVLVTNLFLLRRALSPLERLIDTMGRVEPLLPGERVALYGDNREILELTIAFNQMLDRLESERRLSVRRTLLAQESERKRVAQELHDEVGQTLTAMLLLLDRLSERAPGELAAEAADARESARESLEEVRRIARRLRPEALDELGLDNALAALCERIASQGGLPVETRLDGTGLTLTEEQQVVVYRVTQEALTNVLRHAGASRAQASLVATGDRIRLSVCDDGCGLDGSEPGSGLQGMRERALLVGGDLSVRERSGGGTEVSLELQAAGRGR